ncbi:hypothetical protein WAL17_23150 [Waltera acetigignens]
MEVMAQGNRHIVDSDSKVDNNVVRQKVMDSYQDMLSGKGRDYKVFFAEEGADIFLDYLSDQSKSMSVLYRTQIS